MKITKLLFIVITMFCIFCVFKPSKAKAEDVGASWLRTRVSNALNPKISLIGDFTGQTGPGKTNEWSLRETELSIQSEVDPHTRADFFLSLPDGESIELEEGYFTFLSLPLGFQARGGKFLANFGKLNIIHSHERPQANAPLVLESFLGTEGLNDTGLELSRVCTPFETFMEFSYAFLNGLGEEEAADPVTTTVTDTNGNTVEVVVNQPTAPTNPRTIRNFAHVARTRVFRDITDNSNVELGLSGAIHEPRDMEHRQLAGADMTFRWKPLQEGQNKGFIWRTEFIQSKRKLLEETEFFTGAVVSLKTEVISDGAYSYLEAQLNRHWRAGVRGDYFEDPESGPLMITRAVSPVLTYYVSEFNRLRAQYQYRHLPAGHHDHTGYLQWTVVIGPHGAHPF